MALHMIGVKYLRNPTLRCNRILFRWQVVGVAVILLLSSSCRRNVEPRHSTWNDLPVKVQRIMLDGLGTNALVMDITFTLLKYRDSYSLFCSFNSDAFLHADQGQLELLYSTCRKAVLNDVGSSVDILVLPRNAPPWFVQAVQGMTSFEVFKVPHRLSMRLYVDLTKNRALWYRHCKPSLAYGMPEYPEDSCNRSN